MRADGKLRLVLADDHAVVREGLMALLRTAPRFEIVAACATGLEALEALRRHQPDVAILDFSMPTMNGLDVIVAARQEKLPTRIVLLTASIGDEALVRAVREGLAGLILKDQAADELLACIEQVGAGGRWVPQKMLDQALKRLDEQARHQEDLTARERQIASMVALGLSNKEIARELSLAEGTVKIHLHNAFQKLGVSSRTALVALLNRTKGSMSG
jgi:DNA-binding NarL/FixJ family response regulator